MGEHLRESLVLLIFIGVQYSNPASGKNELTKIPLQRRFAAMVACLAADTAIVGSSPLSSNFKQYLEIVIITFGFLQLVDFRYVALALCCVYLS